MAPRDPLDDFKIQYVHLTVPEAEVPLETAPTGEVNVKAARAEALVKLVEMAHDWSFEFAVMRELRSIVKGIEDATQWGNGVLVRVLAKEWKIPSEGKRAKMAGQAVIVESGRSPGPIVRKLKEREAAHGTISADPGKGWRQKELLLWITRAGRPLGGYDAVISQGYPRSSRSDVEDRGGRSSSVPRPRLPSTGLRIEDMYPWLMKPSGKRGP